MDKSTERRIVIGLIASTEFLQKVRQYYDKKLFDGDANSTLSDLCIEYYDKYEKAPGANIARVFERRVKRGKVNKDLAEEIQEDILPELNQTYIDEGFDIGYLFEEAKNYLEGQNLTKHNETIQNLIEQERTEEASEMALSYVPLIKDDQEEFLDFSDRRMIEVVHNVFDHELEPLIHYPGQLGTYWNDQLVRGGFVALLAPEKRGKSFWLMDFAYRAARQGNSVAFFQAGDMSERNQIRRFLIHIAKKSDKEKYCGVQYEPVRDCYLNQNQLCEKLSKESDFGPFEGLDEKQIRDLKKKDLIEALKDYPDYMPCRNCSDFDDKSLGVPWLRKITIPYPLDANEAEQLTEKVFVDKKKIFLSTHPNDTLTIGKINSLLTKWQKEQKFEPDVIVIDYADLLVDERQKEERHKQNAVWKGLRALSQKRNCLVITATQADSDSYNRGLLGLKNYSEDKRKFGHVTAMYGLNQDPEGREKGIGLMRINEIVVREDEFDIKKPVTVLQNLSRGQVCIGSYFGN